MRAAPTSLISEDFAGGDYLLATNGEKFRLASCWVTQSAVWWRAPGTCFIYLDHSRPAEGDPD
jgi:hypothetical protein